MRRVVITGGSRGIGAATVRRFTAAGDQVYFLYEKSTELARQLEQETGAVGIQCDISQEDAVNRAFQQIGPVDVLVNNAGIVDYNPINWVSAETFRRVMDVNVTGMFLCCKAALSGMLQQQKGAIVNVSSMWGRVGSSCEVAYSAAKAAVIGLTRALAKELGPSGITVNCVSPGVISTEMNAHLDQEALAALAEETPLGAIGTPEDVAEAIWYLSSDAARFVTGQVLAPNGGLVI